MGRFWYKRLITRLDTGTLKSIFEDREGGVVDEGETSFEVEMSKEVESRSKNQNLKLEGGGSENSPTEGKDWQKLMNLLMQLRKICNQYPPHF
jgi:SWI/SNF-related matrix-associated actin-dependent regulator of chromatin subfamily A member 5